MTLRQRLGLDPSDQLPTTSVEPERCACRFPDRHYGSIPCKVDTTEIPLGPSGYCWGCWSARHDLPADARPEWVRRSVRTDVPRVASKELVGA